MIAFVFLKNDLENGTFALICFALLCFALCLVQVCSNGEYEIVCMKMQLKNLQQNLLRIGFIQFKMQNCFEWRKKLEKKQKSQNNSRIKELENP